MRIDFIVFNTAHPVNGEIKIIHIIIIDSSIKSFFRLILLKQIGVLARGEQPYAAIKSYMGFESIFISIHSMNLNSVKNLVN